MQRYSKYVTVSEAEIQKLRKDWLGLAKSVDRVKSIRDVETLVRAANKWGLHLQELWQQIQDDLRGRQRDKSLGANLDWVTHYLNDQKPLWDFQYELRSIPSVPDLEFKDIAGIRQRLLDGGFMSEEEVERYLRERVPSQEEQERDALEKWKAKAKKWAQRGKKKAVAAWKWLKEFADWTERSGFYGGGGEAAQWNIREVTNQTIAGFPAQVIGFDERERFHWEQMDRLKRGLRYYRKMASQRYPWLLKYQLPFKIYFKGGPGTRGSDEAAATYEYNHIVMGVWSMTSQNPHDTTRILAHEMGHHIWKTALGSGARKFWDQSVKGDWGPLDLREVLARMKPQETIHDFGRRIEREDPVLHLQIQGLYYDPRYKDMGMYGIDDVKEALDAGRLDAKVTVPKNPITAYATKNTEEAFCETLGLLVGYGPRALTSQVKERFRVIMPNVRLSSLRVAKAWVRKQRY